MRDLVNLYFRDKDIVNHHIASFDDFLATPDNPNSRMQRIVVAFIGHLLKTRSLHRNP